jgi:hypothetical protein
MPSSQEASNRWGGRDATSDGGATILEIVPIDPQLVVRESTCSPNSRTTCSKIS